MKAAHSIFPPPTFQFSPNAVQNSLSVKPGGSRRMQSLSLSTGVRVLDFEGEAGVAFFLAAASTGKTPPGRLFDGFAIIVGFIHE